MHIYRVSNLAKGKLKGTDIPSGDAKLGALGGEKIHAALVKKHEGMGRYLEQEQLVFLTNDKETTAPILGMITFTPDMYGTGFSTLYIEEGKTITKKSGEEQKGRPKAEGLSQGALYAYFTNLNFVERKNHIVIRVLVGVREATIKATIDDKKHDAIFIETLTGWQLKEKVETYLEKILGKKWCFVPFRRAVLAPSHIGALPRGGKNETFCRVCNTLFDKNKKKYKVSHFYLCNMCFYTTATETEFREKSKEILEKLSHDRKEQS